MINTDHFKGKNAPIFINIGDEGSAEHDAEAFVIFNINFFILVYLCLFIISHNIISSHTMLAKFCPWLIHKYEKLWNLSMSLRFNFASTCKKQKYIVHSPQINCLFYKNIYYFYSLKHFQLTILKL